MEISRRDILRLSVAGGSGTALGGLIASGVNLAPVVARAQALRIAKAKVTPSVCPFCSVGCATLVHTVDGQIVNIEGDSRSPHNEGTLCPKGAATFQLHINPNRPTRVLHRAPGATAWEVWDLNRAMDRLNAKFGRDAVHLGSLHEHLDKASTKIAFRRIPDLDEL